MSETSHIGLRSPCTGAEFVNRWDSLSGDIWVNYSFQWAISEILAITHSFHGTVQFYGKTLSSTAWKEKANCKSSWKKKKNKAKGPIALCTDATLCLSNAPYLNHSLSFENSGPISMCDRICLRTSGMDVERRHLLIFLDREKCA